MRLLVVDDHEVVRTGVRSLLAGHDGWEICGEAVDGQDAVEKAHQLTPDVVIMDVSMPRLNGLESTRQVLTSVPQCRVLILSQHENSQMAREALKAGAHGYVVKSSIAQDLILAINKVQRGEYFFDPAILDQNSTAHTDLQGVLQRSVAFEKALQDSEERLRKLADYQSAVMNNMAEGLYALDQHGLLTSINPAGEAILGWTQAELVGKKMHDVTHYKRPDGSPFPAEDCPGLKVLQEGSVLREHEDVFIRKDGSFVPVVFSASPLRENAKVAGVIVSFRDDTEQRRAREALFHAKRELEISESHLLMVTKSMAISVTRCSKDLRYVWVNQGYSDWLHRPADEIVGKKIIDVLGKEGFERLLPYFERVLAGERVNYEEEVTFPGIGPRWISAVYSPTRDATGTPDGWVAVVWDITHRKRTEEALRDSQRQLALALDSSQTAMFDWDLVDKRGKWNAQMAAIYGFQPKGEYISVEEWRSLFHPEDTARLAEEAERIWRSSDEQFVFEFRTVPRPGDIRWILSHGRIIRDPNGKAVRMIGTHTDITHRKRAEEAVQMSEARLRAAFSQTYSFVVLLQPDGTIIEANRAALDAAGLKATSEIMGRKFWEPWWSPLPEEVARLREALSKAAKGEMVRDECEFCLPDGNRRIGDRTLSSVLDDDGKVIMVVATGLDITERKETEAAAHLLASIVANSDDAIISKTLDGIITSWNKSAEMMFGYSSSEAVGQEISIIVPEDRREEEADILRRLARGERIVHFETVRRQRNGRLIEVSLTISPVMNSLGKIVGASSIARDISAKKQAERIIGKGARQQKALFRLADELLRAATLEDVYNAALDALLDALQCNRASILLYDNAGTMRFQSWRGLSDEYRAAVEGHTAWRRDDPNPQPVCIGNIDTADIPDSLKTTVKKEGIAALAFIPLVSDERLIGKFMTYFNVPHDFTPEEIELSSTIARQLAYAIERKRNDDALEQSEARLRKLSETLDAEVLRQTEQLRTLSYDLLRTQDEERRHIARELHDSAGQLLTVLGMQLAQLGHDAARSAPKLSAKVDEAEKLVKQLHGELRTTSYLLHPPLLDESGLSSALSWYAQGLTERSGIVIDVRAPEDSRRLPADIELAIFRLVQESLTNIHRHSGSKTASITFVYSETGVQVEVSDHGKGISSERLAEIQAGRAGIGIRGMQERLRRFGGTLEIQSNGIGTKIIGNIPVTEEKNKSPDIESVHAAVG